MPINVAQARRPWRQWTPEVDPPPSEPAPSTPGIRVAETQNPLAYGLGSGSVWFRQPIEIPPAAPKVPRIVTSRTASPLEFGLGRGQITQWPIRTRTTSAGPDSIRYFYTGAASDGAAQTAQAACLGNFRSATEAQRIGLLVSTPIPNVEIVAASGFNGASVTGDGLGVGTLFATGPNSLAYIAPSSNTPGDAKDILNGETFEFTDGASPSKWIRARRTTTEQLAGGSGIEFLYIYNNVFGLSDAAEAESSAGGSRYRAVMLRNAFTASVTSLQLYIKPLVTTSVVSSAAQLGGAGAGTIQGATDAFAAWPWKGWARVVTSGGSLREIVYYSSRTSTILTVPALGRGRLGTAAGAGAATDRVWSVPGVRIGFEPASPLANGAVQTIADESTAPASGGFTGGGWSTAITAAAGVQAGTFNYQEQGALWVHRELPAGVSAISQALNLIGVAYLSDGIAYEETLAGMYRIADDDLKLYEIHIGVGSEPDLSNAPTETTPSLPYDTTYEIPADTIVYVVVNYRDEYDLVSQNVATTQIEVDGTQTEITPAPLPPTVIRWEAAANGAFHLLADYDYVRDLHPGDVWKIYVTTDGTEPDTGDLLASVPFIAPFGRVRLDYTTGTHANGLTGKVKVAILRTSDSRLSALSATATATSITGGASTPSGVIGQRKSFLQDQS